MKSIFNIFYLCIALILSIEIEGVNSVLEKKYLNSCEDITVVDDFMPFLDDLILGFKIPHFFQKISDSIQVSPKAFLYKEVFFSIPTLESHFTPPEFSNILF